MIGSELESRNCKFRNPIIGVRHWEVVAAAEQERHGAALFVSTGSHC